MVLKVYKTQEHCFVRCVYAFFPMFCAVEMVCNEVPGQAGALLTHHVALSVAGAGAQQKPTQGASSLSLPCSALQSCKACVPKLAALVIAAFYIAMQGDISCGPRTSL